MTRIPNGARLKILRALATEGILTTEELVDLTALTAKQVRENCGAARQDGLLINTQDDVTNHLAYQITPDGRKRVSNTCVAVGIAPPASIAGLSTEVDISPPASIANDDDVAEQSTVDTPTSPSIDTEDEPPSVEPDAAPNDERYALCRAGDDHMSAWPLRLMSLDAAKQIAVDDASTINGEVVLYCCIPVGRAVLRFVFEEARTAK